MGELELAGAVRGKRKRTTLATEVGTRATDLVERQSTAAAPNRLWGVGLTDVSTWSGFVSTAFIVDAFSRMFAGWRVSPSLHAQLVLAAPEMAL
jgi:putative transposase